MTLRQLKTSHGLNLWCVSYGSQTPGTTKEWHIFGIGVIEFTENYHRIVVPGIAIDRA